MAKVSRDARVHPNDAQKGLGLCAAKPGRDRSLMQGAQGSEQRLSALPPIVPLWHRKAQGGQGQCQADAERRQRGREAAPGCCSGTGAPPSAVSRGMSPTLCSAPPDPLLGRCTSPCPGLGAFMRSFHIESLVSTQRGQSSRHRSPCQLLAS